MMTAPAKETGGSFMASAPKRLYSFPAILALTVLQYASPAVAQWLKFTRTPAFRRSCRRQAEPDRARAQNGGWKARPFRRLAPSTRSEPASEESSRPTGDNPRFHAARLANSTPTLGQSPLRATRQRSRRGETNGDCLPHGIPDAMMYGGPMKIAESRDS